MTYNAAGNPANKKLYTVTETFGANSLNELSSFSRSGLGFVTGNTTGSPTNVTVNGGVATLYSDNTFVKAPIVFGNGTNVFTAVAKDALGRTDTNIVTCYLPTSSSFSYDLNGNLLSDGTRNFDYDDENQLISVWVTNAWRSDFVYDGKMRRRLRFESTWNRSEWLTNTTVRYLYDANLDVEERDANNLPVLAYTWGTDLSGTFQDGGGIGGLLARSDMSAFDPASSSAFYHCDAGGNVTCLVNANQTILATYLYDPAGNVLSKTGPLADANLYRFSSKEYHQNSGTVSFLFRYYDPILHRWLNRDPIEEEGGLNLYVYSFQNAPNLVDPWGLTAADSLTAAIQNCLKLPKCQRVACLEALGFAFPGVRAVAENLQRARDALAQQLHHIFDSIEADHVALQDLVKKAGGQAQAMQQIQSAAEAAAKLAKSTQTFRELATTLKSGTTTVYVNGTVIDGVVHVSTAYAK